MTKYTVHIFQNMSEQYIGTLWVDWLVLILQCLFSFIVLLLFIVWIIKVRKNITLSSSHYIKYPISKFYFITCCLSFLFNLFCLIASIIRIYGRYILGTDTSFLHIVHVLIHTFQYLACIVLYIIFIGRLYFTFRDSSYSIMLNKGFIYLITIFFCLTISLMIWLEYSYANKDTKLSRAQKYSLRAYLKFSLIVLDISFNVILFWIFQTKLQQSIVSTSKCDNLLNESLINLHTHQEESVQSVTRHTILFTWLMIFNEIYWLLSGIIELHTAHVSKLEHKIEDLYTYIAQGIQAVVVSIILYLSFRISRREYDKSCGFFHGICYARLVKKTKQSISEIIDINHTVETL